MGKRRKKSERKAEAPKRNDEFLKEYADAVDLRGDERIVPTWVYAYRNEILDRVGNNFQELCGVLRSAGIAFKVKYPILVDGKWKFADFMIPDGRIFVMLIQNYETIGLPCHSKTNRELAFGDNIRLVPIYVYEIHRAVEKIESARAMKPKKFVAYTDGSSNNRNPLRPAGAAYVILDENGKELHRASKGLMGKTNNFMEMLAIISAVNWVPEGASVVVHSDSEYAINAFSGKYRAKANINLIERYRQVSVGKHVTFEWVRGHNGNFWNEECDRMANEEYQKIK